MNVFRLPLVLAAAVGLVLSSGAAAEARSRIKDIVSFEGVRENQLVGYGLVVGLAGTGDSLRNAPFTRQSLESMLESAHWPGTSPADRGSAWVQNTPPGAGSWHSLALCRTRGPRLWLCRECFCPLR